MARRSAPKTPGKLYNVVKGTTLILVKTLIRPAGLVESFDLVVNDIVDRGASGMASKSIIVCNGGEKVVAILPIGQETQALVRGRLRCSN